uniref:Uncharacterized protein n=1 Tax=Anopheles culicifacies TaxID=139723 RepID=A0A182MKY6_9DIPT
MQLQMHFCQEDCLSKTWFGCEVDIINMTSGGGTKLLRIMENEPNVYIQKLIVAISPSGMFLQRIGQAVAAITYVKYLEPTFQLPEGNTINEIQIQRAAGLRAFIAGSNTHLEILIIQQCTLDRLPQTLPKITNLTRLTIALCMLSVLRLDMLVANQNLSMLDVSYNQIREIFPVTGSPARTLSIDALILSGNQLERLDMSVFASMPKLTVIQAVENRLTHLMASMPTTLPQLYTLMFFDNLIENIDLKNMSLPKLTSISLDTNRLTRLPSLPKTLPVLYYLSLSENRLTQLDLSYFRPYRKLTDIYITSNPIKTVRTSSPVRLPVTTFRLDRNKITTFNITGCDFPNATRLNLKENLLTSIPPVFERFPKLHLTGPRSCTAQCKVPYAFLCEIGVVNMTTDGGAKLRTTIDSEDVSYAIGIEKLIVASSASGPFLQRIAPFTESISYMIYREPVFQVPAGNTIVDIEITNAVNLRMVVVGTNRHLKRLQLEICQLDRVPPTLGQISELEVLFIIQCAMTAVRLDVFANNPKLTVIVLSSNQIRQLFPMTAPPKERLSIATIDLTNNLIERLDMSIFVHMPDLERLILQANRIVRIEATAPVTYPSLSRLHVKTNKISSLDIRNLTLPRMYSIYLDENELTEIPTHWGAMNNLSSIGFERNNLKQVDLSVFARFPNLRGIYLSENKIETIRSSSPITLALLDIILLDNNQLESVNFTGCNFPDMNYISMINNQLTTIPPIFQRFSKARMAIEWNPIKCSNMMSFKSRIDENRLYVSVGSTQSECLTTSSIELSPKLRGCCVA